MSFLAPLFLAGALAIGLPILFHLIRRSTREKTIFSSLMFLQPSPPTLSRRSRLEHLLLLMLRCAAVILLALGFARPFLKHVFPVTQSSRPAKRMVVLLDTSASMRRQNLWTAAKEKAEAVARQAEPHDQVAFFTFDRQLDSLIAFEEWNSTAAGDRLALVRSRLADVNPGWGSTHLDTALIRAAEMLVEGEEAQFAGVRQVVLISDLQEGSQIRALQGHEWPKGVEVIAEPVKVSTRNNAGIQLVSDADDKTYAGDSVVRVRVSNASDSKKEQFQVGWAGSDGAYAMKPTDVYVPGGQSRTVALPVPATNVLFDRIVLKGDDEPFDNTVFVVPPGRTQIAVLYFGGDSDSNEQQPLFFLNRAFQETRSQQVRVVAHRPSTPLSGDEIERATLLVVTGPLAASEAVALREAVARGKMILFAPTDASVGSSLNSILGTQLPLTEKRFDNSPLHHSITPSLHQSYAMLAQIDFRHPLFAPFADPRFSDFSKLHFWRYRSANADAVPEARVLAKFDSGDPAMLEIPVGKGRVILWAACWHPADSQLAVSSKFVPLLYSLLEYSGAVPPAPEQYFVGARVPLNIQVLQGSHPAGTPPLPIQVPDGSVLEIKSGATNFSETLMRGIYSVGTAPRLTRFAVNLEPSESRTAPMPVDELERLGVPTGHAAPVALSEADRKTRLQNSELEARQKLWRWFIVATLGVLMVETWLAGRTWRRSAIREASA